MYNIKSGLENIVKVVYHIVSYKFLTTVSAISMATGWKGVVFPSGDMLYRVGERIYEAETMALSSVVKRKFFLPSLVTYNLELALRSTSFVIKF